MPWPDDLFGSDQEPDADQRMREHDQALAQLRADRKVAQLLDSQAADRASAPFPQPAPISPDRLWARMTPSVGASGPEFAQNYFIPQPQTPADRQTHIEQGAESMRTIGERVEKIAPWIHRAGEIGPYVGLPEAEVPGRLLGGAADIFGHILQNPTVDRAYGTGKSIQDEYNALKTIDDYDRGVAIRDLWRFTHP
jgi:hypothetical protein